MSAHSEILWGGRRITIHLLLCFTPPPPHPPACASVSNNKSALRSTCLEYTFLEQNAPRSLLIHALSLSTALSLRFSHSEQVLLHLFISGMECQI